MLLLSILIHLGACSSPYGVRLPEYPFAVAPESPIETIEPANRAIVCNNHTEFECVCLKSSSGKATAPDCSLFVKSDELDVVDMRMRHVNTESLLYTGITYEEYFKKRLASIVSHYCQHNLHECRNTSVPVNENNVVIVRLEKLRGNITRALFAIRRNDKSDGILSPDLLIDPVKVKYILASQLGPLSRVLGGIKIDSVRAAKLTRLMSSYASADQLADNLKDNSKLIKGLVVVCAFFLTTYCIAFVQCLRYFYKKRHRRPSLAGNSKKYGACDQKEDTVEKRNGEIQAPTSYNVIGSVEEPEEPEPVSQRQMRNWFACDASQLPREMSEPIPAAQVKEESPILHEIPPVVLLKSETPDNFNPNAISRPRSRRGSRIDEEDVQLDLPELKPLAHEDPLDEPLNAPVPLEQIKTEIDEDIKWSSSEEGDVDVYYKMSDEEEVIHDDVKPTDSEEEEEEEEEVKEDPAFVYERLREELSPQPPIAVDTIDFDLNVQPIEDS